MTWLQQNLKIAIAALIIAGVALFFIVSGESGPEAEINVRIDELCSMISYEHQAPQLQQITTAKKLSNYFTERPYLIAWPGQGAVTDRQAVMGMFTYLLKYATTAEVSMNSRQITLDANERGAVLTGTITGKATVNGESERHSGRYRIELELVDGEWLIQSAQPIN